MSGPLQFVHVRVPESGYFGRELGPDARRGVRIGEEDRSEGHVVCSRGNEFDHVPPCADPSHSDDRQVDSAPAGVDGSERNRLERRP